MGRALDRYAKGISPPKEGYDDEWEEEVAIVPSEEDSDDKSDSDSKNSE
ncbi:hypothetical protein ACFLTR_02340 [Chloroflexota bacterium]